MLDRGRKEKIRKEKEKENKNHHGGGRFPRCCWICLPCWLCSGSQVLGAIKG
jgi:hypothetical protein